MLEYFVLRSIRTLTWKLLEVFRPLHPKTGPGLFSVHEITLNMKLRSHPCGFTIHLGLVQLTGEEKAEGCKKLSSFDYLLGLSVHQADIINSTLSFS